MTTEIPAKPAPLSLTIGEANVLHAALHHAVDTATRNAVEFIGNDNPEWAESAQQALFAVQDVLNRFHNVMATANTENPTQFPNDANSLILMTSALVAYAASAHHHAPTMTDEAKRKEATESGIIADDLAERIAAFVRANDPRRIAEFLHNTSDVTDEELPDWKYTNADERAVWARFKSLLADGSAPSSTRLQ